jgi:hypothetical protein
MGKYVNIKLQRLNNATYDISTILKEAVTEGFKPFYADEITKFIRIMDKICLKAEQLCKKRHV